MSEKLLGICPDFTQWPDRWMGTELDLDYGRQVLAVFEPFAVFLAESALSDKTVERHLSNLWLLGGEIIREVNLAKEYDLPAIEKIRQSIDGDGGPYCRNLDGEAEIKSFDGTCKKLHKFLVSSRTVEAVEVVRNTAAR